MALTGEGVVGLGRGRVREVLYGARIGGGGVKRGQALRVEPEESRRVVWVGWAVGLSSSPGPPTPDLVLAIC